MKEKKHPFFILLLPLIILFFVFSYFFPVTLAVFVFGISLIILFVFVYGLNGFFPAIGLIFLNGALNYSRIEDFSFGNLAIGGVIYFIFALVTAGLRKINKNLKKDEEQFKDIIEKANDGIIIIQDGLIKYANSRISDILGYSVKEAINTDFKKYVTKKDVPKVVDFYQRRMKGKKVSSTYEVILSHKTGGVVYTELNANIVTYKGMPADLVIIRDVTQSKKVEDILHQREQEFKILVEKSPDIITRFDKEHRVIYINSSAEEEFGIPPRDFFWKTFKEVGLSREIIELWENALKRVFENEKEKTIYLEHETNKGLKYYYSRLIPEYNKEGGIRSVLSITRDITEIKEIEKVKSDFIVTSSHQLRTPLSVIRWCSKSLLDKSAGKINKEQKDYLDKIYVAVRKMIKITNAFLNVSVLDLKSLNISSDKINLMDISERILKEFDNSFEEKKLKVTKKYKDNIPKIKADNRLLEIVLRGLISNAVKYSPEKGKIALEIKSDNNDIIFKIGDNGHGIPKNQKSKVFTKFFRGENIKNLGDYGIGLDLYIIKSIMRNCEGKIWFKSPNPELKGKDKKEGKGTMFYFTLPIKGMSKKEGEKGFVT